MGDRREQRSRNYGYDNNHRPTTVTYHVGKVVTTRYRIPGVAVGLSSLVLETLVDKVSYDKAGRMTALRLPAASNLWCTQRVFRQATATGHLIVWILVCDRMDPDYMPALIRTFSRVMDGSVIQNGLVFPGVAR